MDSMTLEEPPVTPLEITDDAVFEQALDQLRATGVPEWLVESKQEAWKQFHELPMPHRKDERWRFSTVDRNLLNGFNLGAGIPEASSALLTERSRVLKDYAGRLIFADGELIEFDPLPRELTDQGVLFLPLQEALTHHGELLRDYFKREGRPLGSEKFTALHDAYARSGTLLYVPKNVVIEKPIISYHWLSQSHAAVFPKTLVITEDHAQVNLIELFLSEKEGLPGFASSKSKIFAGPGSKVLRKVIQDWNDEVLSFQNDTTFAGKDARVKNVAVNVGGKRARYENQVQIQGSGAEVKLYSLTVSDKDQEFDQRTLQVHSAPHATSDLLFKNALLDRSKTIFSGLILVEEDGQQTDAYQTNRNLLLDKTAEANALPGLEIGANDVRCSHGATTSNLDEEELFYLQSRGIPSRIAKQLLIFGFFEEILGKFDDQELADTIRGLVQEKFTSHL